MSFYSIDHDDSLVPDGKITLDTDYVLSVTQRDNCLYICMLHNENIIAISLDSYEIACKEYTKLATKLKERDYD